VVMPLRYPITETSRKDLAPFARKNRMFGQYREFHQSVQLKLCEAQLWATNEVDTEGHF
jgi:hypothetical protein